MKTEIKVENISEADFQRLQKAGWVLVWVDNASSGKYIYCFRKI